MRALLLTLTRRPNGHYVTTWRTTEGGQVTHVIASGANLETAIPALQRRLDGATIPLKSSGGRRATR